MLTVFSKGGVNMIYNTYNNNNIIEQSNAISSVISSSPYAKSKRQRREEKSHGSKSFAEILSKKANEQKPHNFVRVESPYESSLGRA